MKLLMINKSDIIIVLYNKDCYVCVKLYQNLIKTKQGLSQVTSHSYFLLKSGGIWDPAHSQFQSCSIFYWSNHRCTFVEVSLKNQKTLSNPVSFRKKHYYFFHNQGNKQDDMVSQSSAWLFLVIFHVLELGWAAMLERPCMFFDGVNLPVNHSHLKSRGYHRVPGNTS